MFINTVADLIDALKAFPQDAPVSLSNDGFFGGCVDKIKQLKSAKDDTPTIWIVGGWQD